MKVFVEGSEVDLDAGRVLGEGGEATVFGVGARSARRAVKIYKAPSAARAAKLEALVARRRGLPREVVAPESLVFDARRSAVVGFVMPLVDRSCQPLAVLARRSGWGAFSLDLAGVLEVLEATRRVIAHLHASGLVVGDLNDQNELFCPKSRRVAFVDADSFHLEGFPCEVATEAFLDPRLYGPDEHAPCALPAGSARRFDPGSDWFAFAVLLLRAVTGAHPFSGVDPSTPSPTRRARLGRSVLSPDVRVPAGVRARIHAMPEVVTELLRSTFESSRRPVLAEGALLAWAGSIRACACGLELPEGRACPACRPAFAAPTRGRAASGAGRVQAELVWSSPGSILALAADGSALVAVHRSGADLSLLRRGVGGGQARLELGAAPVTAWVRASTSVVVVAEERGDGAELRVIDASGGQLLLGTTTELASGRPAFAVTGSTLYRVAAGALLEVSLEAGRASERVVATVVSDQTCLSPAPGGVLLASRVLGRTLYARIAGRARVDLEVDVLCPGERLVDHALYADGEVTVVLRHTRVAGADRVRTDVLDARGQRIACRAERAVDRCSGLALAGGCMARAVLLLATDAGLVREEVAPRPPSASLIPDAAPFAAHEAWLAATGDGLAVAAGGSVHVLRLRNP